MTRLPLGGALSSSEAAFFLCCSRSTVADLIRSGQLRARKDSGDPRFPFVYRIPVDEIRFAAQALGLEKRDEELVESIRLVEFEQRGGEPR